MSKDSVSPRNFTVVNSEGSAFWIRRETDLSVLEPGDMCGNIELLLSAVLTYSRSRKQALSERLQEIDRGFFPSQGSYPTKDDKCVEGADLIGDN